MVRRITRRSGLDGPSVPVFPALEVTRRGGRAWGWTDRCDNPHLPVAGAASAGFLGEQTEKNNALLRHSLLWRLQEPKGLVVDGQQRSLLLRKCDLVMLCLDMYR